VKKIIEFLEVSVEPPKSLQLPYFPKQAKLSHLTLEMSRDLEFLFTFLEKTFKFLITAPSSIASSRSISQKQNLAIKKQLH
jgi:hypothetical protein